MASAFGAQIILLLWCCWATTSAVSQQLPEDGSRHVGVRGAGAPSSVLIDELAVDDSLRSALRSAVFRVVADEPERTGADAAVEEAERATGWAASPRVTTGSLVGSLGARIRSVRDALVQGNGFVEELHVDVILAGFGAGGVGGLSVASLSSLLHSESVMGDDEVPAYVMHNVGRSSQQAPAESRESRHVAARHDRAGRQPLLLRRRLVWHVHAARGQLEQNLQAEWAARFAGGARHIPIDSLDVVLATDAAERQHAGFTLYIVRQALPRPTGYAYVTADAAVDEVEDSAAAASLFGARRCFANSGVAPVGAGRFAWLDVSAGPVAYGPGTSGSGFVSSNLSHPFVSPSANQSAGGGIDLLVRTVNFIRSAVDLVFAPPMARFPVAQRPRLTVALVVASPADDDEGVGPARHARDPAGSKFRWAELRAAIRELAPEPIVQFRRIDLQLPALNADADWAGASGNDVHVARAPGDDANRQDEGDDESDGVKFEAARALNLAVTLARREQLVTSHVDGSVLLRSQYLDSAALDKLLHRFAGSIFNPRFLGVARDDWQRGLVLPVILFNFGDDRAIRLLDQHEQALSLAGRRHTVAPPAAQSGGAPSSASPAPPQLPVVVAVQTGAGRVFTDFVCLGPSARGTGRTSLPTSPDELPAVVDLRDASRAIFAQVSEAAWGIAPTHVHWPLAAEAEHNYAWSLHRTPFGLFGGGRLGRAPLESTFVQRDAAARHIVYSLVNQTVAGAVAVLDRMLAFEADVLREEEQGGGAGRGGLLTLDTLFGASHQAEELQRRLNLLVFKLAESSRSLALRLHAEAAAMAKAAERDTRALLRLLMVLERQTASSLLCPSSSAELQRSSNAAGNLALLLAAVGLACLLTCVGLANGSLADFAARVRRYFVSRQKKHD